MRSSPRGWQRCILGSWLLLATVMVWAYCSTITSAFAVRFVPHPVQSVSDVLGNDRFTAVLEASTVYTEIIRVQRLEFVMRS